MPLPDWVAVYGFQVAYAAAGAEAPWPWDSAAEEPIDPEVIEAAESYLIANSAM